MNLCQQSTFGNELVRLDNFDVKNVLKSRSR